MSETLTTAPPEPPDQVDRVEDPEAEPEPRKARGGLLVVGLVGMVASAWFIVNAFLAMAYYPG